MTRHLFLPGLLCLAFAFGCADSDPSKTSKSPPPAKVEKIPVETEIGRITLTAAARQRLGITTVAVAEQDVSRRRTFGGDVTIPAGKSIIVSAPYPGKVVPPATGSIPAPGQRIATGDPVLSIAPLLTPERDVPTPAERLQMANAQATIISALVIAEGDGERTKAEFEGARITLARAEKLLADRVGTAQAVDDAKAQYAITEANATAAQRRAHQLSELAESLQVSPGDSADASPLLIAAPQAGLMRSLSVTQGQTVSIGVPLFEIVSTDTVWIRVPVYVELLATIVTDAPAQIVGLDGRQTANPRMATPVPAPPSADPVSSTADLYYAMENADGALRPGQRVGVEVPIRGDQRGLTVPAKSLLYDIYGGTWVYEQLEESVYQRHRVLVRFTDGDRVVLAEGPSVGTLVVVDGAAELYGTEFGSGK